MGQPRIGRERGDYMIEIFTALVEFISNSSANFDISVDFFLPFVAKEKTEQKKSDDANDNDK